MRSRPDFQSMQGWTPHDQIDQLRSKLSLKDRDRQAYYEASQRAIAKNENLVLALHAGNKDHRVALAESQNVRICLCTFLKLNKKSFHLTTNLDFLNDFPP
ncbi:uncharacterized protein LOC118421067 [Branchiostoma floridae]|uniref:Uncharacterized protein LOC118421067 n=1 Tax=Branchiostoma floridae TaxID=7739 RepID=A0A9J7MZ33_BRAFL|nr:uncharacterized protein LOC118421067 [Branchiostoma floridae]